MRKVTYTTYAQETDMTFIMQDTVDVDNEVRSTECIGWYHGEPDDGDTEQFKGKLKAEYTL